MRVKIIELYNLKSGLKSLLPSDTLWGNICWGIKYLFGNDELQKFIQSYQNNSPELIISSSFPYYRIDHQTFRFFPRPILPVKSFDKIQQENEKKSFSEKISSLLNRKEQKEIQILEQSFFEKVLNGEADYDLLPDTTPPKILPNSVTRNTIDRIRGGTLKINNTGQLFTEEEIYIHLANENKNVQTGLFFLAIDNSHGKLEASMRLLSHIGIGGNRSIGKGIFEFSVDSLDIREPQQANALTNLSLYYPTPEELNSCSAHSALFNYQLEQRAGFFGEVRNKKYKKNPVIYFKEGSVFPFFEKKIYGNNKIIRARDQNDLSDYDVYQYGIGFMLRMNVKIPN